MAMPPVEEPPQQARPPLPAQIPGQPRPPMRRPEPERFAPMPAPMLPDPPLPDPIPADSIPVMAEESSLTLPFPSSSRSFHAEIETRPYEPEPFAFPYHAQMPSPITMPSPTPAPVMPMGEKSPSRESQRRPISPMLWPFVALNYVVDGCLNLTGFPGRLITSRPVKTLLGLTGLGLIAYTLTYLGQQQGLITLPQRLPWPK